MRALLVVNPKATTTSERSRDILVRALRSEVDLDVAYTRRRGHGAALAREAAADRFGLVVALGGDGTVNEVVNGLMTGGASAEQRPALAVVPGGSTNVFARAIGLPRDWAEAAGVIFEALREGRWRTIGLGRADDRYFTFCAGVGLDAAVVRRVEQARLRGRRSTPMLYLKATVGQFFLDNDRRRPAITLDVVSAGGEEGGTDPIGSDSALDLAQQNLATVIIQNTAPWTYLGDRALDPNPGASFDLGLDILALRALTVPSTTRTIGQMLTGRGAPEGKHVVRLHDITAVNLSSAHPEPFQLDGDYLGDRVKVQFTTAPKALRVVC